MSLYTKPPAVYSLELTSGEIKITYTPDGLGGHETALENRDKWEKLARFLRYNSSKPDSPELVKYAKEALAELLQTETSPSSEASA